MNGLRRAASWFVDSGIGPETTRSDARYVRFLNTTMLVFAGAQAPILPLLVALELWAQLAANMVALVLCALSFLLNRRGRHREAKVVFVAVVIANTAYFSMIFGSSAPAHHWLIPGAALGVLAFKPTERGWAAVLVALSFAAFVVFESAHPELEPVVRQFSDPMHELRAAQGSTVAAMALTLLLVGIMHRRFAASEAALSEEKAKSERLLRAILPDKVAQELRETGRTKAVRHEDVSFLFADMVGFTPLAASMPAEDVVALLADVFTRFDELIARCGVEKIKTIGDAYMVAGGVPVAVPDHAERLARCALGMMEVVRQFSAESGHSLQLRIGLHRGPAVAGVIGTTKFAYDLWGETVNTASRLESSGEPGRIQVSDAFRSGSTDTLAFEPRGEVVLKGVGPVRTHWLTGPCGTGDA
jgi:class 3 adenylate cyclase